MRLARGIHKDEVHAFLERHGDVWELTLVTLDKPYLFSNISGVLSYFGMDIHRGQAMTTAEVSSSTCSSSPTRPGSCG